MVKNFYLYIFLLIIFILIVSFYNEYYSSHLQPSISVSSSSVKEKFKQMKNFKKLSKK